MLLPPGGGAPQLLDSDGPLIGAVDDLAFDSQDVAVPAGARLLVYSDGAFEISRPDGSMWPFEEFLRTIAAPPAAATNTMDALVTHVRQLSGRDDFNDDFSMMELVLG